ncbi:hypothetical protein LCGC14_2632710 [marine sediment metagenome]|uniref:Uncharacterized protein n=1 Tax=marine sediment metagenome TaxID=412755 RepID=A0A0F9CSB0_9ZZZZ
MTKHIKKEYNHWQLDLDLRELLLECRAQEESRYAKTSICVSEGKLAVTDGKRLVVVHIDHEIEPGVYFCTSEGFLLVAEGRFPKYEDIIPEKENLSKIVDISESREDVAGLILGKLIASGCIAQLSLFLRPIEILEKIKEGSIKVFVDKTDPSTYPFLIEAETTLGEVEYIQMPLNIVNEVERKAKK